MPIHSHGVLLRAMSGTELSRVRPNSNDCEYSHIHPATSSTTSPDRQPASHRYLGNALVSSHRQVDVPTSSVRMHTRAPWAASTSKKRNKELPCLLMCPSRCLPALESSLGIIPT